MIEPISLEHEAIKVAIQHRNNTIASRLQQLGAGWAVGVRLKPQPYPVHQPHGAARTVDMAWETHEMQLIDGKLVEAFEGFQYYSLPTNSKGAVMAHPLSGVGTETAPD